MTPSKRDRVFSAAEPLSLPCGDFKTLSRVIPRSGMVTRREPSRGAAKKKKTFYSQFRKLRHKRKKMLQKSVPILHSIAASYKLWKTTRHFYDGGAV